MSSSNVLSMMGLREVVASSARPGAGNMNPTAANTAAHRFRPLVGFRPATAGALVLVPDELFMSLLSVRSVSQPQADEGINEAVVPTTAAEHIIGLFWPFLRNGPQGKPLGCSRLSAPHEMPI